MTSRSCGWSVHGVDPLASMDVTRSAFRQIIEDGMTDSRTGRNVAIALLTGGLVLVLLFYWGGGTASDPPT
jgi:acetoin utilization deacetylase AcuC-like enzyme